MVSPAVQGQVRHPSIVPEFLRSTSCGMTSVRGHGAIVYCLNSGSGDRQTGRHNSKGVDKGVKKEDMALKFVIPPNSLSTIIRNRDKLQNYDSLNSCSKRRTYAYEDFDEAVLKWIHTMRDKNVPISEPFVIEKAFPFVKVLG
ncbi:tigger transposable element-derived protein 4 [Trichonephila clavipes]|nr:tigger transposable element-derived protein 4 [Trichonephila clavipes]